MSKNIGKIVGLPLVFLGIFLLFYFGWKIQNFPSESELIEIAKTYFNEYGLITIFISSIIEGFLFLGIYYPGSLVIFLGVIFSGKDVMRVVEAVSVVTLGLFIAYIINFFLGKYGWCRLFIAFGLKKPIEGAQQRLTKYGLRAVFMTYWHPNLAALASTAAGILHFPFLKFLPYSLAALIGWNIFWGTLVYFLGESSLSFIGLKFVFVVIGAWIIFRLVSNRKISKPQIEEVKGL